MEEEKKSFTVSPVNIALCLVAIFFYVRYRKAYILDEHYVNTFLFYLHAGLTLLFPLVVSLIIYKFLDGNMRKAHVSFTGAIVFCVAVVMYHTVKFEKVKTAQRIENDKRYQIEKERMIKEYAVEDSFDSEQHAAEACQLVQDYFNYLKQWDFDNLNELYHVDYFIEGLKQSDAKAEVTVDTVGEYKEKCRRELIHEMKTKHTDQKNYLETVNPRFPKLEVERKGREFYIKAQNGLRTRVFHLQFQGRLLRLRNIMELSEYEKNFK